MPANLVYLILNSCRYDSYARAQTPNMDRIGAGQLRYAHASWTAPSHHSILMGQVAHESPKQVLASEVYRREFAKWRDRLGIPDLSFSHFVPELSLTKVLQKQGYRTVGRVSMPVLNPMTGLNRYFDDYKLMAEHADFAGMIEELEFDWDRPSAFFLSLGETHYPYGAQLPRLSGVHGVLKGMDEAIARSGDLPEEESRFFSPDELAQMHEQQVASVEYVDELLGGLFEKAPEDTHFMISADHGECFGEGGYFGHGPVMHEKVFEVPFLEGRLR